MVKQITITVANSVYLELERRKKDQGVSRSEVTEDLIRKGMGEKL